MLSDLAWLLPYLVATCALKPPLADGLFVRIESFFSRLANRRALCVVLLFFVTALTRVALLPILGIPHPQAHDEFCYLLQADMLAHGHLAYPPHPMSAYFDTFYVLFQPTYSTIFSPAQALVLALGQRLGHPWIGVLLSTGAMVSAVYWMLAGYIPVRWAFLGAVLALIRFGIFSYWMNSYWGGSVAAIGGALALGALPRLRRSQRAQDAWLMGLGIVILSSSRPLEGFIFCIPISLILIRWLWQLRAQKRALPFRRVIVPISASLLANLIFTLYYNWRLTGSALTLPRVLYYQRYYSVSTFLWGRITSPLHYANPQFDALFNGYFRSLYAGTWPDVMHLETARLLLFSNFYLASLLAISLLALPWVFRDHRVRPVLWMGLFCLLGLAVPTWFLPHYAAAAFGLLWIIVVQAFRHFRQWTWRGRPIGVNLSRQIVALLMVITIPSCIYVFWVDPRGSWCLGEQDRFPRDDIAAKLNAIPGLHLAMVRYSPGHNPHREWVYNAADIDDSKIVWAREIPGVDLAPLRTYYPNRQVWLVEPDSIPPTLQPYSQTSAPR